ncbi:MAG: PAS domain S-box protein [Anaerolineae bacterium]|nr:PAS domain S-box protein [Anaerolineae bacterium]
MHEGGGAPRERVEELEAALRRLADLSAECDALRAQIAQCRETEPALAASEEVYHSVVKNSVDGIVLTDEEGLITEWNEAEERISGLPRAEVLGRPLWEVQIQARPEPPGPGERERLTEATRRALRTGEVPTMAWAQEMPLRRPDGEIRFVQSLVFAIRTARGHMLCAISRDVTDRHRAEASLRESETRFRHLVETSSDLIWEVNADGIYTYVSPRVRDVLGYEPEEVLGKTPLDLLPPGDVPRFEALFRAVRDERRSLRFLPNTNVRKDGQLVFLETNAVPFFDEQGRLAGYRGMDRDVTPRKRLEDGLRLLGEATRVLVSSLDYELVLRELARLAVPTLADWVVIDVLADEGRARPVAVAHADPRKEEIARELQRRYPPDPERLEPYGRVLRTGEPILAPEVDASLLRAVAKDEGQLRLIQELGPRSCMIVPLAGRERTLGAMSLAITESSRRYLPDDLALAQELGRRAGLAVENAQLYRQAQEARDEAERRAGELEGALSAIAEGVIIYGPTGDIVRMNLAAQELLGYTPEELGLPFAERCARLRMETPEGKPFPFEELPMVRALRGETVRGVVLVAHRPRDGRAVSVSLSAAPIRGADGRILGAVATFADITALRELQEERERLLEEAQRRAAELEATVSSLPEGVVIFGPGGQVLRMNEAGRRILAYTDALGRMPTEEVARLYRLERPDGRPLPFRDAPLFRAFEGETILGDIVVLHPPDGRTVWISASAAPIRTPDGRILGVVGTFSDVTALHQLEEQREDLVRAVSHDLRNPLAGIMGQAELLLRALDRAGMKGRERQNAEAILRGAQRMNALIQDLVDTARMEAGRLALKREPIDLPSFVASFKERLAGTMETARIRVVAEEGLPPVSADPDRLERILTNLLSNALKYSTPGTEVTVTFRQEDGEVVTAVSDRGPGIAPDELPHLFERYYRTRAARARPEGLGLGLYVSRLLVQAHGGRIWAESQVGVGSTFSFSLPVVREEPG